MKLLMLIAFLLTGQAQFSHGREPFFKTFQVNDLFKGPPAAPHFTNPEVLDMSQPRDTDLLPDSDSRYRETVELEETLGPNFAGHFTIAPWSCGSECISMVVIDAKSGLIYRSAPFGSLVTPGRGTDLMFSYRLNSSLLIAEGCFDEDLRASQGKPPDCGRKVYNWTSSGFVLLSHKTFKRRITN